MPVHGPRASHCLSAKGPPSAPSACPPGQCIALPRKLTCPSTTTPLLSTSLPASYCTALCQDSPCRSTIPTLLAMSTTSSKIAPGCLVARYPANLRAICACKKTCGERAGADLTLSAIGERRASIRPVCTGRHMRRQQQRVAGPHVGVMPASTASLGPCVHAAAPAGSS